MDFGRLFFYTLLNYNKRYASSTIERVIDGVRCNWVFFLQTKWNEGSRYVNATQALGMNGITENSVIICERKPKPEDPKEDEIFNNTQPGNNKENEENKDGTSKKIN